MDRHNAALAGKLYSVSPVQTILDRLDNVRPTRDGYRADCPAGHRSKGVLSIAVSDEGAVLMNCFAGCETLSVLNAIGLELKDLYPQPIGELPPMQRRERWQLGQITKWKAALAVLERECDVLTLSHDQIVSGHPLRDKDLERLQIAGQRIRGAKAVLCDR